MYLPRAFAETDLTLLDTLIDAHPFVSLISIDAEGTPFASHLPVLYRRDGNAVLIEGHWARPNPQANHDGAVLMIVHGPDAYVSPGVYPDKFVGNEFGQPEAGPKGSPQGRGEHKETAARVPTWNYAIAHLRGTLERYDDEAALGDLVDRLSQRFEATVGRDWRFEMSRDDHRGQLRGIVGFRFRPERIDLKFKLSQNHPPANRQAVRDDMAGRSDPGARAISALMRD